MSTLVLHDFDSARTTEASSPVAAAHFFHSDSSGGLGSMNEVALADADPNVAEGMAPGFEEHEVTAVGRSSGWR
jgi:hypothetical protein